jgi:hypothetical protein
MRRKKNFVYAKVKTKGFLFFYASFTPHFIKGEKVKLGMWEAGNVGKVFDSFIIHLRKKSIKGGDGFFPRPGKV